MIISCHQLLVKQTEPETSFPQRGKKTLAALTDKENKCEQRLYKTAIYTQKEN